MKTPLNIVLWFALCSRGVGCVILMWYECGFSLPTCMTHHGLGPANIWQIQFWATFSTTTWDARPGPADHPPQVFSFCSLTDLAVIPLTSSKRWEVGAWFLPTLDKWWGQDFCPPSFMTVTVVKFGPAQWPYNGWYTGAVTLHIFWKAVSSYSNAWRYLLTGVTKIFGNMCYKACSDTLELFTWKR